MRPTNLSQVLTQVEKFQNARLASWYRGVGSTEYSLTPSIGRSNPQKSAEELAKIETSISITFSQRSPPFTQMNLENEWRKLFYMQHHGIPTRLLDWSESPFVAMFFALTSVKRGADGTPLSDAAIWACDPIAWNRTVLSHITYQGGILDETCEEIKAFNPIVSVDQRPTSPVMIYGTHNSARIVAQRGVFALFGKGSEGMETIFLNGQFQANSLIKIIIPKESVDEILHSLYRKGIAESTIYPDLFGLALEIKRLHGYF